MKKLCVGVLFASALLFAQTASAEPCGLCQAYYPCYWPCERCVGGWWYDGYCTGEVVEGTCGDIGQCSGKSRTSNWSTVVDRGVNPERCAQSLPALMQAAPPIR